MTKKSERKKVTKIYSGQEIREFYRDVAAGRYKGRQAEADAIDADIVKAHSEGRIQIKNEEESFQAMSANKDELTTSGKAEFLEKLECLAQLGYTGMTDHPEMPFFVLEDMVTLRRMEIAEAEKAEEVQS